MLKDNFEEAATQPGPVRPKHRRPDERRGRHRLLPPQSGAGERTFLLWLGLMIWLRRHGWFDPAAGPKVKTPRLSAGS